jgi:hypothetical protein
MASNREKNHLVLCAFVDQKMENDQFKEIICYHVSDEVLSMASTRSVCYDIIFCYHVSV